jgi:hypothetical protein
MNRSKLRLCQTTKSKLANRQRLDQRIRKVGSGRLVKKKFGVTSDEVKAAVKSVGPMAKDVEDYLKKNNSYRGISSSEGAPVYPLFVFYFLSSSNFLLSSIASPIHKVL